VPAKATPSARRAVLWAPSQPTRYGGAHRLLPPPGVPKYRGDARVILDELAQLHAPFHRNPGTREMAGQQLFGLVLREAQHERERRIQIAMAHVVCRTFMSGVYVPRVWHGTPAARNASARSTASRISSVRGCSEVARDWPDGPSLLSMIRHATPCRAS